MRPICQHANSDERLRQQDLLLQEQLQDITDLALDIEDVFKCLWL